MSLLNKRILVTGGAGFIGRSLTSVLSQKNQITIFDNFSRGEVKSSVFKHPNVRIVKGDILDYEHIHNCISNHDYVVHLAAICGIQSVLQRPVNTIEVNFLGTYNILKASHELNVERVFIASTSEVYGQLAFKVNEETSTTQGPISESRWGYAVSKLATEYLSLAFYHQYKMNVTTFRPFNIYGPGQIGEGAIHNFIINAIHNDPITIYGDGNQIRSWCYIEDLVSGLVSIMEKPITIGKSYNIGNPSDTITILRLAKLIKKLANSSSEIKFVMRNEPVIDVYVRVPDISRIQSDVNFTPTVDLEEGIKKTIEYYKTADLIGDKK